MAYVPTVYIQKNDNGYRLIRNGEPYFIKGAAAHPDFLEELKEAGANTARIYDTVNLKATLDKAQELGLAVAVDIPLPKFHKDPEFWEDQELFDSVKYRVRRAVQLNKDHPALLYWNLGNELYYPYLYKSSDFHAHFNELVDLLHKYDPNHPVSTTTIGANKKRVISIERKTPQLDFISFNAFGKLTVFKEKLRPISLLWDGPVVLSEWGINGPWEAELTAWRAPIEPTSTKKAEQIKERYYNYLEPLSKNKAIGSFIFYWGKKDESTPTWFSLFGEDHQKTQAVFELENIWKEKEVVYKGPKLDYILLNEKGALENIVLSPGFPSEAEIILPKNYAQDLKYTWEIRPESWYFRFKSTVVEGIDFEIKNEKVKFKAPEKGGPYRLFVYLTNDSDYFATANIPFYVLNQEDGE